ncbi:MAG: metallophosphoesterase family protein [Bacteroidota bacterium]
MKIGLLSDTHGSLDEKVFHHFDECDEIWHAGDVGDLAIIKALEDFKPLKAVHGNIDGQEVRQYCPEDLHFTCEGVSIFLTHIASKPPFFTPRVRSILQDKKPDVLVCGHTHILRVVKHKDIWYLNPGACGYFGFHTVRTLLRFEVSEGELRHMEVIELGPNRH